MLKLWFVRLNLLFAKEVSWYWFVLAVTLFLTAMNFNIFAFCFKYGESDFVEALSFVAIGFFAFAVLLRAAFCAFFDEISCHFVCAINRRLQLFHYQIRRFHRRFDDRKHLQNRHKRGV